MSKSLIYLIIGITSAIGGYLPTFFNQSAFGGWSILGTLIGGLLGVYLYVKLRDAGYLE